MAQGSESVIAVVVQAVLHGLYFGWKMRDNINRGMLAITVLLFLIYTTKLGTGLRAALGSVSGDELAYSALDPAIDATGASTFLIVDGVLVYRCWIVNAKSRVVTCPAIVLWLATLAASLLGVFALITTGLHPGTTQLWSHRLPGLYDAFYSCSIATNVYATSAILFRLHRNGSGCSPTVHYTCRMVIESGGLFTVTSILNLVVQIIATGQRLHLLSLILKNVNIFTAGITFNLILIRVYVHRTR